MHRIRTLTDSVTRPGDTNVYADGDLIANSTTAGSVVPLSFNVGPQGAILRGLRLTKSDDDLTNDDFTIRLYAESPTVNAGDNGALAETNDAKPYAILDVGAMNDYGTTNGLFVAAGSTALPEPLPLGPGNIYALLEANAAYTPANSEVFTLDLIVETF